MKKTIEDVRKHIETDGLTGLLKMKVISIEPNNVVAYIDLSEDHLNLNETVHGGTLFALADTVGGTAVMTLGQNCTTVNGSIEYMRSVKGCKRIICTAKVIKCGKTLSWVECDITNENGVLLSTAKFVYYTIHS